MYGSSIHKTLHVSHVIYFRVHSLSQSSHIDSHSPVAVYCTTLTRCAAKERDMPEVGDPMFAWSATSRGCSNKKKTCSYKIPVNGYSLVVLLLNQTVCIFSEGGIYVSMEDRHAWYYEVFNVVLSVYA